MKIKSLRLENFQGIPRAEFSFEGLNASIYGDNATGKTTVFNAVTWLLFDKASTGAKNFTPKTKGADGDLHNLDHSAEATFIMPTGEIATFRKVYHEVWKKKRGSSAEEFDGHTVDYYIDGVPMKEKQYTETLQNYCGGIERMKILTMPDYFAEVLPWDERRKILIDLCGDVTDADVISSSDALKDIDNYLRKPGTADQFYSVEEYKKIASVRKGEINKQLQALPGRIDEARRAVLEADGLTFPQIQERIEKLAKQRQQLMEHRAGLLNSGTAVTEAKKKTAEAEAALNEARNAYLSSSGNANAEIIEEISNLQTLLGKSKNQAAELRQQASEFRRAADRMTDQRQALLRDYAETQALMWDEAQETCPACGQRLPADRIDELKNAFNQHRSDRLMAINERGQAECSSSMIEDAIAQAEKAESIAEANDTEVKLTQERIKALNDRLSEQPKFELTEEYFTLSKNVTLARMAEKEAKEVGAPDTSVIDQQILDLGNALEEDRQIKARIEQAEAQQRRIAELEDQEKQMGAEYETLEYGIWLCDEFTKAKVKMLTSRIDGKFENVRFRLFQEQLNGGVKDDCEVLIPGDGGRLVPYSFANNAARINAGLEIIGALSAHWKMEMPVFIDNAESVTHLTRNPFTQTIRLVVSESDPVLRLELDL